MTVNTLKNFISRHSETVGTGLKISKSPNETSSRVSTPTGEKQNIDINSIRQLIPLRNLSEDELLTFSIGGYAENFKSSVKLFVENEPVETVLYLLSGTLRIESKNGRGYQISAGTAQSRFPLSSGDIHTTSATTVSPVTVLRVSKNIMSVSQESIDSEIMGEDIDSIIIPSELENSQLFQAIYQNYTQEQLALSILPSVVGVIARAMSRGINERQAARIIETDAVLAAKLISVANSPLFFGAGGISTVFDAVDQIGLKATQYLVNDASKSYLLSSSNRPYVERVQRASAESLMISGLCFALATWTKTVDPKQALTAGLLSNIGMMPFAHYVDKFPSQLYDQVEIDKGWPMVRGFMGSFVLNKLGLPKELSSIPADAQDWMYDSGDALDLVDIVIISRLLVQMNDLVTDGMPPLEEIPAVQKLGGKGLTPELSRMLKQIALNRVAKPLEVVKQAMILPKQVEQDQTVSDSLSA
jgi:HD-like signal output (HDOD) protein